MTRHPLHPLIVGAALATALTMLATAAVAQTWEYKSYKKDGKGGTYNKDRFTVGTISVEEKDGKASFRMVAGGVDACLRGAVPAVVTRTAETTLIELQQTMAGCDEIRYLIRNDGSGGEREVKRGDRWAKDGFDHGLTPAKP